MKAAWDWRLPRETPREQRELVAFTAELGFDTLVVHDPTPTMRERAAELDIRLVDIINARPTDRFSEDNPDCLQELHPTEEQFLQALRDDTDQYYKRAHRWDPLLLQYDVVCYEHDRSREFLKSKVADALDGADGVAIDGMAFRNQYGCFCEACDQRRCTRSPQADLHEYEAHGNVAEAQLVEATNDMYDTAQQHESDGIVMNHVWPGFTPNPYYGHRLELDYCTQTISWFYPPRWSCERIRFEAAEHARLENGHNTFVPFVGMHDSQLSRRPPERLRDELEIALEYGDGSIVFSTLAAPYAHDKYADIIADTVG